MSFQAMNYTNSLAKAPASGGSGCGVEHDFVGQLSGDFSLQSGETERNYFVHLPENYDPNTETPLMVAFHPKGTEPDSFGEWTGLTDSAVNPDFITVVPRAAVDLSWQGAPYSAAEIDDLQFTTDLIEQLKQDFCIDEGQIYAVGHSNGGGMVAELACSPEHGEAFAGFAAVSAAVYLKDGEHDCDLPDGRRPLLEIHGYDDNAIPYLGGDRRGEKLMGLPIWVWNWANAHGCDDNPEVDEANGMFKLSWVCDGQVGLIRHVGIEDMGHGWSQGNGEEINGEDSVTGQVLEWIHSLNGE